jgi:hypothetical protein
MTGGHGQRPWDRTARRPYEPSPSRWLSGLAQQKVHSTMHTTAAIALLVAFASPMQVGSSAPVSDSAQVQLVRLDDAHTVFTPNAPDAGRAGQVYQLPQGGFGVSTGGTSYYQTLGMPGGSGVAVPNGNNTSTLFGSGGRIGTIG